MSWILIEECFGAVFLVSSVWSFNRELAKCSSWRSCCRDETWQEGKAARSLGPFYLILPPNGWSGPGTEIIIQSRLMKCDLPLPCDRACICRCVCVDWDPRGPTLHHEDDIRVKGRIEEVDKRLGSKLSCPRTRRVPGALCTHTHTHTHTRMHTHTKCRNERKPKETNRGS